MPDEAVYYREVTSVTLYGSIFIANNDDGSSVLLLDSTVMRNLP